MCWHGVCVFAPVCDTPWPECVYFQSGFISIVVLNVQSHVYTNWTHSLCSSSYRLALPGLVFLSRRWVKSLLLLTDPCKSLTHTFLLLLHGKAVVFPLSFWLVLQSVLVFMMVIFSFALVYGQHAWYSRWVDPLEHSVRCVSVLTCLLEHV